MAAEIRYDMGERTAPAAHAVAVSAGSDTELAYVTRGIYVGGAGNVKVTTVNDEDVTFTAVPAGTVIPVHAKKIWLTGTTASSMLALY